MLNPRQRGSKQSSHRGCSPRRGGTLQSRGIRSTVGPSREGYGNTRDDAHVKRGVQKEHLS